MTEVVGMMVLTGAAPTNPAQAAPQDKRVAVAADLIALVERAMVDPNQVVQPGQKPHPPRPQNVVPMNGPRAAPLEVTVVHLRSGGTLLVKESVDEVVTLRARALPIMAPAVLEEKRGTPFDWVAVFRHVFRWGGK